MLIIPRSATSIASVAGTYVRNDAVGLTCSGVDDGDEVETSAHVFYECKGQREHWIADSFSHREVDLTRLPFHEMDAYDSAAPTVADARFNTKDYLDDRITSTNMQDTLGRNYKWIACYAHADYPFSRVFLDKGVDIIYTVDTPDTTAKMDFDQTPAGYIEKVPIHIMTLDTEVNHLAEAELRWVVEENPTGSQRGLDRMGSTVHDYGSTKVYDSEFLLTYSRGTT